jgi:hypothetical protein
MREHFAHARQERRVLESSETEDATHGRASGYRESARLGSFIADGLNPRARVLGDPSIVSVYMAA